MYIVLCFVSNECVCNVVILVISLKHFLPKLNSVRSAQALENSLVSSELRALALEKFHSILFRVLIFFLIRPFPAVFAS